MGRTAQSAMAARWSGGQVTMGPHGRDHRVRATTRKRRTPAAPAEDSGDEPHPEAASSQEVVNVEE